MYAHCDVWRAQLNAAKLIYITQGEECLWDNEAGHTVQVLYITTANTQFNACFCSLYYYATIAVLPLSQARLSHGCHRCYPLP
jgi:hypothetical protein